MSLHLTVTSAEEICLKYVGEIRETSSGCGSQMMELPTRKMVTEHGFTFQSRECLRESNLLLCLKT